MRLSNLKEHLRSLRNMTRSRLELRELGDRVSQMRAQLTETRTEASTQMDALANENRLLRERLAELTDIVEANAGRMTREMARLNGTVGAQRRAFVDMTRRLEASAPPAGSSRRTKAKASAPLEDPFLDVFYREFEDRYRGTREEILQRLRPYLAQVSHLKKSARIVDLGCGRGEWLEVLREDGFSGLGVDSNDAQAHAARELDLDVEIDDIIEWTARQKDRSIDFISAFHVIEHMEFPALVRLLKEIVRVLRPGGILLLETPNPESLIVGAYKFWFDPTHVRPYPPELVTRLLETLGLGETEVLRLHPDGRNEQYKEIHHLAAPVADLIAGPLDYAVICRRP